MVSAPQRCEEEAGEAGHHPCLGVYEGRGPWGNIGKVAVVTLFKPCWCVHLSRCKPAVF